VIVFAISDKGGTGRSVTSANVAFRKALQGANVAYVDFDFGSPTAGAVFGVSNVERGVPPRPDGSKRGLHSYILESLPEPLMLDVWEESDRRSMRETSLGAGKLVLLPGDLNGGEPTQLTDQMVSKCATLLLKLESMFDVTLVDLSAGRSVAAELAILASARPEMHAVTAKWLVFHRWTKQHLIAAAGLRDGLLTSAENRGHDRAALERTLRFVRTAFADPDAEAGLRSTQVMWLREVDTQLSDLARRLRLGNQLVFATVPLDPLLQWQEQLITDFDVDTRAVANKETVEAFEEIASKLDDPTKWSVL
jgi:MinD-like ATPase involved in chromosome partitioning or flagellar assembly